MRRILTLLILLPSIFLLTFAKPFGNEIVNYKVMYKWGLINKQAGTVAVKITNKGDKYYAMLTARSEKWADRFYKVRDTLKCEMLVDGLIPLKYEKLAHEADEYTHDQVLYRRQGATVFGDCSHIKFSSGKLKRKQDVSLDAIGTTLDMLSTFYYMRELPYATWKPGEVTTLNIFSGRRKELLTIKYKGKEMVEYDDKKEECYRITFIFTTDGKTKSSDDMSAWISVATGIPVKMEGKLPVGSVRAFYTGSQQGQ